jgi:hypothetical protein
MWRSAGLNSRPAPGVRSQSDATEARCQSVERRLWLSPSTPRRRVLVRRPGGIPEAANRKPGNYSKSKHDERLAFEFEMPTAHYTERSAMQTPEEPTHPDVTPAANKRRAHWLAAAEAVVAVAAVAGIAYYAVSSTKPGMKVPEFALTGDRSPSPLVHVQGHPKMQAYGPEWSLRRPIEIGPYFR